MARSPPARGDRAYIGTPPTLAIDAPTEDRPDVGVGDWPPAIDPETPVDPTDEPDVGIAVAALWGEDAQFVERQGRLVADVELVSPRNKDRVSACAAYSGSSIGYLLNGGPSAAR